MTADATYNNRVPGQARAVLSPVASKHHRGTTELWRQVSR